MVSGRLVGISVSPFPLQSTMLLLQVQDSGHCNTLHAEDDDEWWPRHKENRPKSYNGYAGWKLKAVRIHSNTVHRCVCVLKPLNNSIRCWGAKLKHVLERQHLPSSTSWKASAKDSKKKQKSKEKQWDKVRISAVKLASVIDKRAKCLNPTYLCRQTPSSAPRPRCAPSSAAGPCTACKGPDGGAVATTLTARLRDSHTAGCWSAGGWGRDETDGWGG